jgi:hypothetical protein
MTLCALAASLAISRRSNQKAIAWWAISGLAAGLATLFRPDGAIFIAAVGFTLVALAIFRLIQESGRFSSSSGDHKLGYKPILIRTIVSGLALFGGFVVVLTPWTLRNARVLGVFQPIAPRFANMPGEFVPKGYLQWLRTWVDDVKYTETMEFPLDVAPLHIERVPDYAFDSPAEREQVAALLERYNGTPIKDKVESQNHVTPDPQGVETPKEGAEQQPSESKGDDQDTDDDSDAENDEDGDSEKSSSEESAPFPGELTPEIDAGFAEIARAHISHHPIRYYLLIPSKRAVSLWFDTHSQYYPFQGELFPLSDLNTELKQQYWLPLFAFLTVLYTILGLAGTWLLWINRTSRQWVLLIAVLIIPRLAFLAMLENPEPRYVVEFFGFVLASGSIAISKLVPKFICWITKSSK